MSVSMERLRVATLNVWNKSGPWAERMTLVREQMSALALDVLGLQEVLELETPAATTNQADELKPVGWHRAYAAAHDMAVAWVPKGQSLHFGNALLSRFPIVRSSSHPLPGADLSDQKRCVLHAVVEAPFGEVDFFVTHLNWKLDEGWIRELQVKTVAKLVAELAPDDGRFPPVVMGDFNAEPQSDEIRYLGGFARLGEPRSCASRTRGPTPTSARAPASPSTPAATLSPCNTTRPHAASTTSSCAAPTPRGVAAR